uniref:non-specific serine/threonine protein kinase n=1 Tax=Strigamia maritima TaxID=126957 RepID=T1IT11_STRMM
MLNRRNPRITLPFPRRCNETKKPIITLCQLEALEKKDPNEILVTLIDPSYKELMTNRSNSSANKKILAIILKLIAKGFSTSLQQTIQRELMAMLLSVGFLRHCLRIFVSNDCIEEEYCEEFYSLISVITEILHKFPAGTTELEECVKHCTTIVASEHLDTQILQKLYKFQFQIEKAKRTNDHLVDCGRTEKDFRGISILPTLRELQTGERPVLRNSIPIGPYEDAEHFFDVQFRLTREDFIATLVDGILEHTNNEGGGYKKHQDVVMHKKVEIGEADYTKQAILYKLYFNANYFCNIKWDVSKRLIHGSLLCLSSDNFQTVLFAVVADRQEKDLKKGIVTVKFEDHLGVRSELTKAQLEAVYTVAESRVFYEAYRPVLKCLQTFNVTDLPFQKYIIQVEQEMDPPAYLTDFSSYDFTIKIDETHPEIKVKTILESATVLDINDWPSTEEMVLDESQRKAMHLALTSALAIIQGPPGTGKTYVGLKIMQTLLNNQNVWMEKAIKSPILIVATTNHALDQFLEGVLEFTKKIVRVGSRSESKKLEKYTLKSIQDEMKKENIGGIFFPHIKATEMKLRELRESIEKNKQLTQRLNSFILHESALACLSIHDRTLVSSLVKGCEEVFKVNPSHSQWCPASFLATWLGMTLHLQFVPDRDLSNFLHDGSCAVEDIGNRRQHTVPCVNADVNEEDNLIVVDDPFVAMNKNRQLDADYYSKVKPLHIPAVDDNCWSVNVELLDDPNYLENVGHRVQLQNVEKRNFNKMDRLNRSGKLRKAIAHRELLKSNGMTDKEVSLVRNVWNLSLQDRWRLYRRWINQLKESTSAEMAKLHADYENTSKTFREILSAQQLSILKQRDVIGMTTTGSGRLFEVLSEIKPKIVIVEEAAKVLESHIVTVLTSGTQHLILIGDQMQLRPDVNLYELSKYFKMDVSLFERLINNKVGYATLQVQHRMRPEISRFITPYIYKNLRDHPCVEQYLQINGITSNIFFFNHDVDEDNLRDDESHANTFEAEYLVALCRYLLQQNYNPLQITILTPYVGQLRKFQKRMKRDMFEGVRVTTVDGYQGEENDIILISFVRSNKNGQIGFIKFDNRVNVAISRAKMGLYCVGNFDLFASRSKFCASIIDTLKTDNMIGNKITLKCQKHGKIAVVKTPDEFKKNSPEGGCQQKCDDAPTCPHPCERLCHADPHKCMKPCPKILCVLKHNCPLKCFEECKPCEKPVLKQHPDCKHSEWHPCHVDIESVECMTLVERQLACGHTANLACHVDPNVYDCLVIVTKEMLLCDHNCEMFCHQDPNQMVCPFKCEFTLNCGHVCSSPCHPVVDPEHKEFKCVMPCVKIICKNGHLCKRLCYQPHTKEIFCCELVEKQLPCGHKQKIPCLRKTTDVCCTAPCNKTLSCGHLCKKACSETCGGCSEVVELVLACKHKILAECSTPKHHLKCLAPCQKTLSCGHACSNTCSQPCETKCMHILSLKSNCGHMAKIPCHLKGASMKEIMKYCKNPCREKLPCQHNCVGTCGECLQGRVHVACKAKCGRIQICGHKCTFPCALVCPPCDQPCAIQCEHRKCLKQCGQQCIKCTKKCSWSCPHHQCTKMCYELCDRTPCNQHCKRQLKCGHLCAGLCGEKCPNVCKVCNKREIKVSPVAKADARFIELFDCGHCFEVGELDRWMKAGSEEIGMKQCPRCKAVIWRSARYGNLIKGRLVDIQTVKQHVFDKEKQLQQKRNELHKNVWKDQNLRKMFSKEIHYVLSRLSGKWNFYLSQLVIIQNQVNVLKMMNNLIGVVVNKVKWGHAKSLFDDDVVFLVNRLMQNNEKMSLFEVGDVKKEFIRAVLRTLYLDAVKQGEELSLDSRAKLELKNANSLLMKKQKLTDEAEIEISSILHKLAVKIPELGQVKIEPVDLVNEIDLSLGIWYKCVEQEMDPPAYLTEFSSYDFTIKIDETHPEIKVKTILESATVLDINDWPSTEEMVLDESQRRAMHLALTSALAIIQGPPGTGKTYVGLKIMQTLLNNQKVWMEKAIKSPILIVATTNHALDQFLEGVLEFTEKIVRVGNRSESEKLQKFTLKSIRRLQIRKKIFFFHVKATERKLIQLRETIERNEQLIHRLNSFILHEMALTCLSIHDQRLVTSLKKGSKEISKANSFDTSSGSLLASWLGMNMNSQFVTDCDLDKFYRDGSCEAEDTVNRRHRNRPAAKQCPLQEEVVVDDPGITTNKNRQFDTDEYSNPLYNLYFDHNWSVDVECLDDPNYLHAGPQAKRQKLSHNFPDWLIRSGKLRKAIAQRELLKSSSMTDKEVELVRNVWKLSLQDIIVEEAAKVLESHIVTALTSGTQHLILIGDHMQLRPDVNVYQLSKRYNMDVSLFERLINNNVGYATLQVQHRMRPEISRLITPYIYKNLRDHPCVEQYPQINGITSNIFFFNHGVDEDYLRDDESHANTFEAEYLVALCRYLLQQNYNPLQITILTPYIGQLSTLRKHMRRDMDIFAGVRVTTVDGYQGEENDIILISFVRSNKDERVGFLNFDNRVNVAISRAKMGLYCVGNFELFAKKSKFWESIMNTLKKEDLVGNELTLKCQQHGTLTMEEISLFEVRDIKKEFIRAVLSTLYLDAVKQGEELSLDSRAILDLSTTMWSLTQFLLGKLPETANFREISIYPSIEELLTEEKPNLKANIIKGPYQDVDHYLDVQFRLTREDYIAPLRDGIQYYRNNSALSNDGKNQTVWIHEGVKIGESKCARHKGVLHELHFNEKEFSKIKWDTPTASKRFIHGSLLCLSNDNFETIRSAVVSDPKDLQKGIVIVKFQDDFRVNKSNSPRVYTVAELQTFFEAYRPMLQGLQTFNTGNLPLQKYIIKVQQQLDPPAYLNYSSKYKFTVKIQESNYFKSGRVLDINDWPETEILSLDESQREAMHLALTSSLAIIQGPPGTGKTHVALKIMQTLLNNQKIWLGKEKSNPILVVAVTNRALDQFLEGVLQFTQSIIRVGSQSKSEKLEKYTLMYIQEQARLNRKKQDFLSTTIKETETRLQKLRRTLESNIQFIENFHTSIFEERVFTYISTYDHRLVESLEHGWCDIFKVDSFIYSRWNPISYLRSWLGITLDDMFISNRELEYFLHGGWNEKDEVCRKIKAVLGIWRVTLTEVVDPKIGVSRNSPQCVDNHIAITGTYSRGYHQGVSVINRNCRTANVSNYLKSDTKPNNFRKSKSYIAKESQLLVNSGKLRISIVQRELATSDFMTDEEISCVRNVWSLSLNDRWRLYLKLRNKLKDTTVSQISKLQKEYEDLAKTLQRLFNERKINTLRQCDVIGMTTTCAATNLEVLSCINPKIVIVEEAAKVLESHIICALTSDTQHLILIGDHKQLRPQVNVDRLAKQYHLDISLFERLIHNNIGYATLQIQHRMRPEISQLLVPYIYKNLTNHPDVEQYPQIKGVTSNMFFLNHNVMEDKTKDIELHVNSFEANYLVALCRYFLQQSYEPSQITILTAYNGQLNALQKRLAKDNYFEGVRLTTVDGYQGEENDIILISFVRNNKKGQIGFLKFDNRVNVAISRARMGLYCVGNFELFATKSEFWASVMDILKRDGSVGYKLTLKCQQHEVYEVKETQESQREYGCGGYYRVKLGKIFHDRYLVIRKLGWGFFSTVWLGQDLQDTRFVALKIVKSEFCFTDQALNEIELLKCVMKHNTSGQHTGKVVQLIDNFIIKGINGINHVCMVLHILGPNLSKLISSTKGGLPLDQVKSIMKSLLENLDFLHNKCKIIHADIKPENICLNQNGIVEVSDAQWENLSKNISSAQLSAAKEQLQTYNASRSQTGVDALSVTIADLGNACWVNRRIDNLIQTRYYRCPEVILGVIDKVSNYGPVADIWSAACVAFELATGQLLFPVLVDGYYRGSGLNAKSNNRCHFRLMMEMYGPNVRLDQRKRIVFDKQCCGLFKKLTETHKWDDIKARHFTEFLQPMLAFDPNYRFSALKHEWITGFKPPKRAAAYFVNACERASRSANLWFRRVDRPVRVRRNGYFSVSNTAKLVCENPFISDKCCVRKFSDIATFKFSYTDRFVNPSAIRLKTSYCPISNSRLVDLTMLKGSTAHYYYQQLPQTENWNFRKVSILPSIEELQTEKTTIMRANIIQGPYQTVDHYLDVQFRLTREDYIAPLRDAIHEYRNQDNSGCRKYQDVWMHEAVQIGDAKYTRQGVLYNLHFNGNHFAKVRWTISKRFIHGSLLCLSNNNFQTVLFAVVADRKPKDLRNGIVTVKFEDDFGVKSKLTKSQLEAVYTVAESRAFFEAYRPVLKGLQTFNAFNLPLQEYIVQVKPKMAPPAYLTDSSTYDFRIKFEETNLEIEAKTGLKSATVLDIKDWPSTLELGLDDSQRRAMHLALSSALAIIQGPPGTGKTYVGLKIMQILLNNQKIWMGEEKISPILVVSMTNHALDQFLEGVLDFTESIVRVGSRSESENLQKYTLKNIQDNRKFFGRRSGYIYKGIKNDLSDLRDMIESNMEFVQFLSRFILHENVLKSLPHLDHTLVESLQNGCIEVYKVDSMNTKWFPKSFLATWLGMTLNPMFVSDRELDNFLYDGGYAVVEDGNRSGHIKDNLRLRELNLNDDNNYLIDVDDTWHAVNNNRQLDVDDYTEVTAKRVPSVKHDLWTVNIEFLDDVNYLRRDCQEHKTQKSKSYSPKKNYFLVQSGRLRKAIAQRELVKLDFMEDEEIKGIGNVWNLSLQDRWRLYRRWINKLKENAHAEIAKLQTMYENSVEQFKEFQSGQQLHILKDCDVIGMTTTGAARYFDVLTEIKPKIVIVEEAAKVLESHIITALTSNTEHLILIGDHKQLRPEVNVHKLSQHYNLDISLFERLIMNNIGYATLQVQHRMRPEISQLIVPYIYQNLTNHPNVEQYHQIKGIESNMFFLNHNVMEDNTQDDECHINTFEAEYMVALCYYLLQQNYQPNQITILTAYNGQFNALRSLMSRDIFEGVQLTTVDRFQGEENDIILISFVRNNKDGRIGFLKFDNRVNVAISRAKMALYCVGNFELFACESDFWRSVTYILRKDGLVGNKMPLKCQKHGNLTMVEKADDFKNISPEGGCLEKCGQLLNCSHICNRLCHPDGHMCKEPIERMLACGHTLAAKCHIDITGCKCDVEVTREFPFCGHTCKMLCYQSLHQVACQLNCEYTLKCGHKCYNKCHALDDPEHKKIKCHEPCKKIICKNGHTCKNYCSEPHVSMCTIMTEKALPCGHMLEVMCVAESSLYAKCCGKTCTKTLPCGHLCQKKCSESCEGCDEMVEKVLECKHTVQVRCSTAKQDLQCSMPCERMLSCSHGCSNICGQPCDTKCMFLSDEQIDCGHMVKVPCHLKGASMKEVMKYCVNPCGEKLSCQHRCVGTCGECVQGRVHVSCKAKCGRIQICGHRCKFSCALVCPPCEQKCINRCQHQKCPKLCGTECIKCTEECGWSCSHYQCSKMCHELCDRMACNQNCKGKLKCGHQCIGLCGEKCPNLCRICDKKELNDCTLLNFVADAMRFIQLDCGHCFEVNELDDWMQADTDVVGMKVCPKCEVIIWGCFRYGNLIKMRLADVQKVKQKMFDKERGLQHMRKQLQEDIEKSQLLCSRFLREKSYLVKRLSGSGKWSFF